MDAKVYVIRDNTAINFMVDNDVDGFKNYLAEEEFLVFEEPEIFDSEAEALAFCAGLGYGCDERAIPTTYPLRSFEEVDRPFIEAIENY